MAQIKESQSTFPITTSRSVSSVEELQRPTSPTTPPTNHKSLSFNSNMVSNQSPSKVGSMLAKISQSKPSFWRPTMKGPGTIKQVNPESPRVIGANYPLPTPIDTDLPKAVNGETKIDGLSSPTIHRSGSGSTPSSPLSLRGSTSKSDTPSAVRFRKFDDLLNEDNIDLTALRKLAWQGIPIEYRSMTWKLLLEYLPTNRDRRSATLERKRKEYCDCITKYFDIDDSERSNDEKGVLKQVYLDVPRTNSSVLLFQSKIVQDALARILYIWGIRHPASGYVQGINDLVTPFFVVFLGEYVGNTDVENYDVSTLEPSILSNVEADSYWCLSRLLDGIQDNYTFAQLGIQRSCLKLSDIIHRVDAPLFDHFRHHSIDNFIQFAFRWMNCLLMRELPLELVIRVWDTYMSELETFGIFHVYACAAFLARFSEELRQREFQDIMLFLKNPPTNTWTAKDIELLLSQAYMWKTLFEDSPKHLEES